MNFIMNILGKYFDNNKCDRCIKLITLYLSY